MTLWAGAAYAAAAGLVFGFVGLQMLRRAAASDETRRAQGLYALWWLVVAATSLLGALMNLLGAMGFRSLPVFVALNYLNLLAVCVAVWALLYFVVYLLWGNGGRTLTVLSVFYGANFLLVLVHLTLAQPAAVVARRWRTDLVFDETWHPALTLVWGTLVFAPLLMGVFAYFSVYFRAADSAVRYRIVAVSLAVLVWLEGLLLSRVSSVADHDGWQVASHILAFASALIVLAAYHPPSWLGRRLEAGAASG